MLRIFFAMFLIFASVKHNFARLPFTETGSENYPSSSFSFISGERYNFHRDTFHQFSLRYAEGQKGLKPWIAPGLLLSGGIAIQFMPAVKENIRDFMQENMAYQGSLDDYLQFAPLTAVFALNAAGIKGKNNFGNTAAMAVKSILLNDFLTTRMKHWINSPRPNQGIRSFPSGHTSTAFTFAHFMHREFGERSPWFSIGAYTGASAVGFLRMAKNAHWFPDILMGAGVGILSTEFVYLTHQYKWDNEHLRKFDIFPFQTGNQKGVMMVYSF